MITFEVRFLCKGRLQSIILDLLHGISSHLHILSGLANNFILRDRERDCYYRLLACAFFHPSTTDLGMKLDWNIKLGFELILMAKLEVISLCDDWRAML